MERKKFNIPQVPVSNIPEDNKPEKKNRKINVEPFVSPVHGKNVKDELTFSGAQFGNSGRQYDAFRDPEARVVKDDFNEYVTYRKPVESKNEVIEKQEEAIKPQVFNDKSYSNSIANEEVYYNKNYNSKQIDEEPEYIDEVYENEELIEEENLVNPVNKVVLEKKHHHSKPKKRSNTKGQYMAPPLSLLKRGKPSKGNDMSAVHFQREKIDQTLREFNIPGRVVHFTKGPAVTQFEVQLEPGVKITKVNSISNNIMANLKASRIRIQAPIPGKSTVGIEVPNPTTDFVLFGELLQDESFLNDGDPMNVVLGLDLSGQPVYLNLAKMPHCLIGGTTGSGKSVCINSIITSILYKAHPDDVKLILIDPKIIEFSNYEDMPHLATPVITEPKMATAALKWAVEEMQNRYHLFRTHRCRDFEEYAKVTEKNVNAKPIPYIVIVIDELADLMMISGNDVEDYIQRITQKGRASGIHMIVATQRPSVDVIKGTIKTNIPTRIAFHVKTQIDSSIILDHGGAEKLLGHGDMLFNDSVEELRLQGTYISNDELALVTDYIRESSDSDFLFTEQDLEAKIIEAGENEGINDEYFESIARFVVENESASINRIQKTFGVGFNRAQSIMQALEDLGIVSENLGSRARTVEVNMDQLESILSEI
ncbi:MAG: DNA translocase FtsK [Bacilli bacterium]